MCFYPQLIRNPKYKKNKKNGGIIPPFIDQRVLHVPIGCGDCMECRKQKARAWQIRLLEDIRHNRNGKFIALTFSNESITKLAEETRQVTKKIFRKQITMKNGQTRKYYRYETVDTNNKLQGYALDNAIATLAMRRFNERYRKKFGKALRHWTVTELGHNGTENIHLHGIVWTTATYQELRELWQYGFIWPRPHEEKKAYVGESSINYVIKYVHKRDDKHRHYNSIILASAGIGGGYTQTEEAKRNKFNEADTKETYRTRTGHQIAMPVYWRNKIYSDQEREALWLHKLDKEERWIGGERVDVSRDTKSYWKLLKWYRRLNQELGYGQGKPDWNQQEYENERRIMLHGQRGIKSEYGQGKHKEYDSGLQEHYDRDYQPDDKKVLQRL